MNAREILEKFNIAFEESGEWLKIYCPFHPDERAGGSRSGSVNSNSGGFKCFSCNHSGDIYDVVGATMRSSRAAVMELLSITDDGKEESTDNDVSKDLVERWHQSLLKNQKMINTIMERKGVTLETIKKWRLGISGDRVTIPVTNYDGVVVNVRQWSPTDKERKVINMRGKSRKRLFPVDAFEHDMIVVTEGEFKSLLCWQNGLPAVSTTGGAGTWSKDWGELFKNKNVIVLYDIDHAGREGAAVVCRSVAPHAKSIKNVLLPLDINEYATGDVTDWFTKAKKSIKELWDVINGTPEWKPAPLITKTTEDEKIYEVSLAESSLAKYYNKFVSMECVVSAKESSPFIVPKKYKVSCLRDQDICIVCPIKNAEAERPDVNIDCKDPILLELVHIKQCFQADVLKRAAGIPRRCPSCVFNVEETYNIEDVRIVPQLKTMVNENGTIPARRAFYVGHGMEMNTPYKIIARSTPEPQTQFATLLVYDAKTSVDSISAFNMTPEVKERLSIFSCAPTVEEVEKKLGDIYSDFEANITRIYQRRDMHLVYDLVYHSVLYVPFQGRSYKGWVEGIVIGDSSQGKSETIKYIMQHYGLGEKLDAKNATNAGLLGGLQETTRRWFISWGVITLNDRKLVALDEIKGMSTDTISKLTDARSSGVVELSKIEKAKTTCRCRLIWISNPRSERQLSTYNYGVEAIKELIGALEDVRRFDIGIAVASGDVPDKVINTKQSDRPLVEHRYKTDLCRDLILWAWSRTADKVRFEPEAMDAILQSAIELGSKYSSMIPLVEPADQRLKMARLSAALAARLFSTDETGETLVVHAAHVKVVHKAIDRIYSSKSFGYDDYSALVKGEGKLEDESTIEKALIDLPHPLDTVRSLLDANVISAADFMDWSAVTYEEAKSLIGHLVRKRALKRYRAAYVKTPPFLSLLKRLKDSGKLSTPDKPAYIKDTLEKDL